MAIILPDSRQLDDDITEALRLRALRARELGHTEETIAQVLGLARETVCRWWTAYQRGGLDAVPARRTGRPKGDTRLDPGQQQRIRDLLAANRPDQLGVKAPLWTRRAVAELILKEFGVTVAERTVGTYLRRWGFTPQKPRRKARKQDPAEVKEWLETTFPEVKARAEREGAEIWFADETGVDTDEARGRGYAPKGATPEKGVSGDRGRVNALSAITAQGEVEFLTYRGTLTSAVFLTFLTALVSGASRKLVLVVDRLKAHVSDEVLDWLADHQQEIVLVVLPRYAPELNPVEYLNNDLKGNVHAQGLPSGVEELREHVKGFLEKLRSLPSRVASFFCHPAVQYATVNECD